MYLQFIAHKNFLRLVFLQKMLKNWFGSGKCKAFIVIMYKTAVYTLVNGAITHQKPQI